MPRQFGVEGLDRRARVAPASARALARVSLVWSSSGGLVPMSMANEDSKGRPEVIVRRALLLLVPVLLGTSVLAAFREAASERHR